MALDNPVALTWIFSYKFADNTVHEPELAIVKTLLDYPYVQYLAYHVVEHSKNHTIYIRGILRCHRPRSLLQVKEVLPLAIYKPLRGVFTALTVSDKLRATNRKGVLYEYGVINPNSKKRAITECTGGCPCCCTSNKRSVLNT